ncbi:MAG: SWIM zinc finger family protein [Byssovorax sp.]
MARRSSYSGGGYSGGWGEYPPYVSVAERKDLAAKEIARLTKKGQKVSPVVLESKAIAGTFWGKAWCTNLERYSDYESRLPRGRSYVRSGAVVDLQINPGKIAALVRGSSLYTVTITIEPVDPTLWKAIVTECTGKIDSVVELLRGKLSTGVMEIITREATGLFPAPQQIGLRCSCPDSATMCKHVAAALYGVGARLDREPEMLFRLRSADPAELVTTAAAGVTAGTRPVAKGKALDADLASVFGIDIELGAGPAPGGRARKATPGVEPAISVPVALPVARAKAAKRGMPAAAPPPPPRTLSGRDLLLLGVPSATVQYWLKTGVLSRTEARGVYGWTPVAEERLARFRAR